MFLLESSTDETAPRSLKTPRSDCSLLRHHLEGTPTCGKFAGLKPGGYKILLNRYRLRLLPCVPRQTGRIPVHAQPLRRHFFQPARIPAVRIINLLLDLVSGHAYFVRINHDHVVARIQVRRKARLVLADQHARDLGRQPPQHDVRRVHYKPVRAHFQRFGFFTLGYVRPHCAQSHLSLWKQKSILKYPAPLVNELESVLMGLLNRPGQNHDAVSRCEHPTQFHALRSRHFPTRYLLHCVHSTEHVFSARISPEVESGLHLERLPTLAVERMEQRASAWDELKERILEVTREQETAFCKCCWRCFAWRGNFRAWFRLRGHAPYR